MRIVGIALLIGGMALSIGAPSDARDARVLAERGVDTTAVVTDKSIRGGGRGSSPYAVVDVEFQDELGTSHESSGIVYCGETQDIAVGDEVEITYDPDEVAPPQFTECPQSRETTIPVIIGIVVIGAGTLVVLWDWGSNGFRPRWWGVLWLILGILFFGTSFEGDCRCPELIYTGGALVIIGVVPLVAPRKRPAIEAPTSD